MVMMAVRSHFRPEFINRIDEFIMFDPLEQEQIKSIVRLQVCCGGGGNKQQTEAQTPQFFLPNTKIA